MPLQFVSISSSLIDLYLSYLVVKLLSALLVYTKYTRIYTISERYINKTSMYIVNGEKMDMKVKHDPTKKLRDIAFGSSAERGLFAMEARHFKVSSDSLSQ